MTNADHLPEEEYGPPSFFGIDPDRPCTCAHGEADHGYGGCEADGCTCVGHWEE